MTQLENEGDRAEDQKPGRPWMAMLAAAVLVVVAGLVVVISTGGEEEPPPATEPTPVTTQPAPPTTAFESAPSTDPAPTTTVAEGADALPAFTGQEPAGRYRTMAFQLAMAFTIPADGWVRVVETSNIYGLGSPEWRDNDNDPPSQLFFQVLGLLGPGSVEETVAELATNPGLDAAESAPVFLGGAEGQFFTARGVGNEVLWEDEAMGAFESFTGHEYTFYVVNVYGVTVLVVADYRGVEERQEFEPAFDGILESIEWPIQ